MCAWYWSDGEVLSFFAGKKTIFFYTHICCMYLCISFNYILLKNDELSDITNKLDRKYPYGSKLV